MYEPGVRGASVQLHTPALLIGVGAQAGAKLGKYNGYAVPPGSPVPAIVGVRSATTWPGVGAVMNVKPADRSIVSTPVRFVDGAVTLSTEAVYG
ncbi:MAG: hypothetical protein C0444_00710 [Microbacterium sp.]|nr:hypothetical protein [Microbacterium sp.]MBA4346907.1 hypothetical protein [Microbacterium sp.]